MDTPILVAEVHEMPRCRATYPLSFAAGWLNWSAPDLHRKIWRENLFLLIILLLAVAFRIRGIDQPYIDVFSWREADDASIAHEFYTGHWNVFLPKIGWNGPGSSYVGYEFQLTTYLAYLLYNVVGVHDWVGRSVCLAFGLLGIVAFHGVIRVARSEREAAIGAFLMAVDPAIAVVDRTFVPDPVMMALTTTGLWLLAGCARSNDRRLLATGISLATLAALTKITALIVGFSGLYVVITMLNRARRSNRPWIRPFAIYRILSVATIVAYYTWAVHVSWHYPPFHVAARGNWIWDHPLTEAIQRSFWPPELLHHLRWLVPLALLPFIMMGIASGGRGHGRFPANFHFWLAGGVLFLALGAKEVGENPWNFQLIQPALLGLATAGLVVIGRWLGSTTGYPSAALFGLVSVCAALVTLHSENVAWVRFPYSQESCQLGLGMREVTRPDDLVVTVATAVGEPTAIYYSQRRGWIFPPAGRGLDWASPTIRPDVAIAGSKNCGPKAPASSG